MADKPRGAVRRSIDRTAGKLLAKWLTPNQVTVGGIVTSVAGCILWMLQSHSRDLVWIGLGTVVLGAFLDGCDGSVAYLREMKTDFGAELDSLGDRLVETAIFAALAWTLSHSWGVMGAVLAAGGSFTVTYARSRAEKLGLKGDVGWGAREIRLPLLGAMVILGYWIGYQYAGYAVAALAWLTVFQRVRSIHDQLAAA